MNSAGDLSWPASFRRAHGRPLRVLHIGNIANNAYLNSRILDDAGIASDVLCYGYYHAMGFPEWEDADYRGGPVAEERPDWSRVDLNGFERPRWFAQGPFQPAYQYLQARRHGPQALAAARWMVLDFRRGLICGNQWSWLRRARDGARARVATAAGGAEAAAPETTRARDPLTVRFRAAFPTRADQLGDADINDWGRVHGWSRTQLAQLFGAYDVVHAYGTEPILPLLAGTRPYVAFEHGTLRSVPFEASAQGRLTALAYREAAAVLLTNADNARAAARLGILRYRFVPHPVNEYRPDPDAVAHLRSDLCAAMNADFLLLHPSRQHWQPHRPPHLEKANDYLIHGLRVLFEQAPRAAAVFVDWGRSVEQSKALIADLGIAARVKWIAPQSGPSLARHMAACDIVADQFFLGAFGAITPRALYLGRAALLYLNVADHEWCFPEPPPVLNARTAAEIGAALLEANRDREGLAELGRRGAHWYTRYHSNAVVKQTLIDTYRDVLETK